VAAHDLDELVNKPGEVVDSYRCVLDERDRLDVTWFSEQDAETCLTELPDGGRAFGWDPNVCVAEGTGLKVLD
jgi:hypothetical protein